MCHLILPRHAHVFSYWRSGKWIEGECFLQCISISQGFPEKENNGRYCYVYLHVCVYVSACVYVCVCIYILTHIIYAYIYVYYIMYVIGHMINSGILTSKPLLLLYINAVLMVFLNYNSLISTLMKTMYLWLVTNTLFSYICMQVGEPGKLVYSVQGQSSENQGSQRCKSQSKGRRRWDQLSQLKQ